ncbi:acyl-CoA dehydrogenase family protein [Nocardia tengchongensis]|uniref:acyl-CoA dehydrogenase family protein n=1 Tax=Nocardia tengchongensis TaxID=2055889 RepID=UPI0036B7CDBE
MTTTPPLTSAVPDLLYDSTHDQLRDSLRGLLTENCTTADLLEAAETRHQADTSLWDSIAGKLGLAGLLIPTEFGGDGATTREVAVVMEELGRAVAPVPYLASSVLATTALVDCARAGSTDAVSVLERLAAARLTATLVVQSTRAPHSNFPASVRATPGPAPAFVALSGTVTSVLAAHCANVLVVPATLSGVPVLALVDPAYSVRITPRTSMDTTRPVATVDFDNARAVVLSTGRTAVRAMNNALRTGTAMLAAEQVGLLEWTLETACSYLTVRHQFGRPIGSYQALRHRAAQMWIALGQARATSQYAAAALATDSPDADVAASLAKAHCTSLSLHAIEDCLQMHGGVGFTWEHPIHLRLKRAFAAQLTLGSPDHHLLLLGDLLDIPAPEAVGGHRITPAQEYTL